ncbi:MULTISPECIES: DUF2778 domain-containing protein [Rhizobium/Agrobacterium group]|uniref:DUF2778 domain-containing protein n=1 Tax=Rhizobium/Agrobacterium group TaxID=227290 RepID=UPI0012E7F7A7|nr:MULTISPECIES: DUF2778 domain-containing protein [Rhizobium/Agrobacterium group]MCF1472887.1 DUF2778 domain-containing protein [Allorhizobium ampelinum]MVA54125.1 DUF2778 domain-containing protein [Agrobacterium vitis]NSZ52191.1 DUF2778 domain-containing protein [Agrobacterium vitis]NTA30950.1 DUF2778 domain-containing protein [Agrobacterium vitis]
MPITCTYKLNSQPISILNCSGLGGVEAFSGMPQDRNNPSKIAEVESGPLPPGRYYIVDRQSGGRLGWLYDILRTYGYGTDRNQWFALYRDDGKIDDETFINAVKRGAFRLHPIGPMGRSEGCITVGSPAAFARLSHYLREQGATIPVPGTSMKAYGTVEILDR